MSTRFRAALVQMCSGLDVAQNVKVALAHVAEAASRGADYVQTPEVTTIMDLDRDRLRRALSPEDRNPELQAFCDGASRHRLWLHIGSMGVLLANGKIANRSYVIDPSGSVAARYDKIHMFDVDLGNGESYLESASYEPGGQAVIASLPWAKLGLTICYDVRFPHLHRALAKAGATLISAPAAFTKITGEAHWHVLLRARAIESQCFVLAAAQGGRHENGRETFGHSLIIDPWGQIVADGGTSPGLTMADIDVAQVDAVRQRVPSLANDRPFTI